MLHKLILLLRMLQVYKIMMSMTIGSGREKLAISPLNFSVGCLEMVLRLTGEMLLWGQWLYHSTLFPVLVFMTGSRVSSLQIAFRQQ